MVDRRSSGDKMEENDGSASDGEHGFEEYEDDDFNATHDSNFGFNPDPVSPQIEVITKESLLAEQVMDILARKEHNTRSLLVHYRWDVDKLFSVLAEKGKNELYAEAGVPLFKHGDGLEFSSSSRVTCAVCAVEVPANERRTMECGHYFCNTCWTDYFALNIKEGQSWQIGCTSDQCNAICDESKVRKLLGDKNPNLAEKFDYFLLKSYVEDSTKRTRLVHVFSGNCGIRGDREFQRHLNEAQNLHIPVQKHWLCGRRAGRGHKNGCPVKEKQVTRSSKKNERVSVTRKILAFSYPFAYYMFGKLFRESMTERERTMKQNLFEAHQQELEENVKMITSLLKKPLVFRGKDSPKKFKKQILDHSVATDMLCRKLRYNYIENDLLGSLNPETHRIAPYKSIGMRPANN
ncbi:hypothetical protein TIFTF001_035966 [Ficus carica]|uniref:RBR-type E3 ubiquitin transferase n=1 Tax=Ficus carica TaxID=3494 RepID=A0AA88JA70_FICCA|nr:hypothetical protein TIFTF001_035966 [Ficus carica]